MISDILSSDYLEKQRQWLLARRESKNNILQNGGQQALLHSPKDIVRIDFALKRIDQGQYGICTHCGYPIEMERLGFTPETPFCSDCQIDIEARRSHAHS